MNIKSQKGAISRVLIVVAIVMLVGIVIVFFAIQFASKGGFGKKPVEQEVTEPEPIYEIQVGDIRFLVESAIDLGNFIPANHSPGSYQQDIRTTEKFIKVTIRAQNKGKVNTKQHAWEMGHIIDSQERIFPPSDRAYFFVPRPDLCGVVLKPEFEPTPCVRFFEVSKVSTDLFIRVSADNSEGKKESAYMNLDVK